MRSLLRLEEFAQFMISVLALIMNDASWWVYLLLALGPDIGMLGYLVNTRVGAITYNMLHHKGIALVLITVALYFGHLYVDLSGLPFNYAHLFTAGIILYGHASMDRIFGYGLKFGDNFHHTHLGWIGKLKADSMQ